MDALCENCNAPIVRHRSKRAGKYVQRFCQEECRWDFNRKQKSLRQRKKKWARIDLGYLGSTNLGADYSEEEIVWLKAMDRWKREHNYRMPTCRDVLGIARALGYRRITPEPVTETKGR